MTVLVVDDDVGARALMRRVLVREFNVNVVEADDGVTGLERLLAEPIDLLLLDIRMRVMDGLRTLETVRRSPKYATLPVVMLTGMADQERVARAMQLGVRDFIVKPLTQSMLRERLSRFMGQATPTAAAADARLSLTATDRVLVVDEDETFREFFATTVTLCEVEGADTELAALKQAQRGKLAALFVGRLPGLLDPQVFLQTLRGAMPDRQVPIIAVVPSRELEETRASGAYHGVIVRSFDAGSFARGLAQVLHEGTVARLLFSPASACVSGLATRVSTRFSELLQQEIAVSTQESPAAAGATRWLLGSLTLNCGSAFWELRLHVPFAIALQIQAVLRRLKIDEVSDSHVMALPGELLTTQFATYVRDEAAQIGLKLRISPARVGTLAGSAALTPPEAPAGVMRTFVNAAAQPVGVIQLLPRNTAAGAG
jgi:two-component system, chemotaxis family, chemotaxis protein CheY